MDGADMKRPALWILVVVTALLALGWGSGAAEALRDPAAIRAVTAGAGLWAPVVFMAVAFGRIH